ncbi:MAG TPA: hypothetical protein VN706_10385 [Gemmatimonadaceae bacterium]|nr:hypothetical protein [Gemmatimonadaceae bacterium]
MRFIAVLVLVPGVCAAQRGGFGGRGRGIGKIAHEPGIDIPRQVNPVNLLIAHRQELALSDSQFMHIVALKRTLDSTNAPLMRRLDSVQHVFRGGLIFSEQSREHRDSVADARMFVKGTSAELHDNYLAAREKAFGELNATQYAKAVDLEASAEKAIADEELKATKSAGRSGPPLLH